MLEIVHIYCWTEIESKWFIEILDLLYGPYLLLKDVKIDSNKLKNITIDQLPSYCDYDELKVKIKYEPMQKRLLPEIVFQSEMKTPSSEITHLLGLCSPDQNTQFSCTDIHLFAVHFIRKHLIKRGFYDPMESTYFLLMKNDQVYELSCCGFYSLGNISLDLNVGFFGACENLLHEQWNEHYFIPWVKSQKIKSPFPVLVL